LLISSYKMPKVAMDYSKTVIYHFVCQDEMIKCSYVGSTTNFSKRKGQHKADCTNEIGKHYHYKVYQTIRENGGWSNWEMKPLEEFPCENKTQQMIREQYWIDQLKPEMNCKASYLEGTKSEKVNAYYKANTETIKEQHKIYQKINSDKIKEQKKEYREANKDQIKERKKVYREANADKIKEKKSIKYTCECGSVICFDHKAGHERSQKHQTFLANML